MSALRTRLLAALLTVPLVVFAIQGWHRRWMSDDGFINLRVVRNLLDGHGPVFNVGERVEAYTSTLWIGVVAGLGVLGVRLEVAAVMAGLTLSVAGMALAIQGALVAHGLSWRDPSGLTGRLVLPVGAAIYAVLPPAWDYATSGLETGLSLFWLGASFLSMTTLVHRIEAGARATNRALLWRSAWLGLGPLVRPELALFSIAMVALLWADLAVERRRGFGWRIVMIGVSVGAVPLAYQLFRMGYFATLTPNTALAKEAFGSRWDQGLRFFKNTFGLYQLLLPMGVALMALVASLDDVVQRRAWRRVAVIAAPIVCGVVYVLYVVRIGGGFMHGRLFLPGVFCFLMPMAALPLRCDAQRAAPTWVVSMVVLVAAWCVVCGSLLRVEEENEHGIGDERGWYSREAGVEHPVYVEHYADFHFYIDAHFLLDRAGDRCQGGRHDALLGNVEACETVVYIDHPHFGRLEPHRTEVPLGRDRVGDGVVMAVQRSAMGIAGYVTGPTIHLVDHLGLSDPLAARMELTGERASRPGHEKSLSNDWFVARFAADGVADDDPDVAAARRALACGELGELVDAVTGPLTWDRFVTNIGRAPRLQQLRIPTDPHEAQRRFCDRR